MKKTMTKIASLLLVLVLVFAMAAASAEEEYPDELIVGSPTALKGDFFTEMFGNDTADIDVRALIHGYNLVNWDQNQGVYRIDPSVVTDVSVFDDSLGNRTYYLVLADDLFWSDGTPITAWDYAFSILLMMAPEIEEIGGKIYRAEHILGYREYITGEADTLAGLEVIDDRQLAITLDHDFLPYFFETGLLLTVPYPIRIIAPGCKVYDDERGCYIANEDRSIDEPIFTADLLRRTILDPETGYNSHPAVSSGPYVLTDFDGTTAHFTINEYFKGAWVCNSLPDNFQFNWKEYAGVGTGTQNSHTGPNYYKVTRVDSNGKDVSFFLVRPTIRRICYTLANNDTMAEDLAAGRLHLVNKVTYGPTILECMGSTAAGNIIPVDDHEPTELEPAQQTVKDAGIKWQNYPRVGLSFLTFTYERPTVHDMEVRQAIAWCMDRETLTRDYTSGFGKVVNGYYGIEQWEYLICTHQIEYPVNFIDDELHLGSDLERLLSLRNRYATNAEEYQKIIAAWEQLSLDNLTVYRVDTGRANALLDDAGWTLNREGEPYVPGRDDVRCKEIDGELIALDLTLMYPRGNHIVDTIDKNFLNNLAAAGIRVTLVPEDMEALLASYYRETERTTDMIYLGTNFHVVVDPSITYSTDTTAGHLMWNNTYSDDEDLYWRAVNMRKTEPEDVYDYVAKWISFQERYNEVLPAIPVYSNIYFDFWTPRLKNYSITGHVTWTQAILEAYFGEAPMVK